MAISQGKCNQKKGHFQIDLYTDYTCLDLEEDFPWHAKKYWMNVTKTWVVLVSPAYETWRLQFVGYCLSLCWGSALLFTGWPIVAHKLWGNLWAVHYTSLGMFWNDLHAVSIESCMRLPCAQPFFAPQWMTQLTLLESLCPHCYRCITEGKMAVDLPALIPQHSAACTVTWLAISIN